MSDLVTTRETAAPETFAAIDALHRHVIASIKEFGWNQTMDALITMYVTLSLREQGVSETEYRLETALDKLSQIRPAARRGDREKSGQCA